MTLRFMLFSPFIQNLSPAVVATKGNVPNAECCETAHPQLWKYLYFLAI